METIEQRLVSSWSNGNSSVPPSFVQPLECRPCKVISPSTKTIPLIDFGEHDHAHTIMQILNASQEYGFFQVINHGVSKDLMNEALNIFKEFHAMPGKEKVNESSKDPIGINCKIYPSNENYKNDAIHYWKDTLSHPCPTSGELMEFWPQKPTKYCEIVGKYTQELNKLAHEILEMLCEGLGLKPDYFSGGLSENPVVLGHHYPPCPDPSLTLGIAKHKDPTLITILLQDQEVHGLQVLKDHVWIPVEPIPNAFVINIGLIMQIITNGRLIGAEHRVVTNSKSARTSIAYFIYPSYSIMMEPAQELVDETNPPIYNSMSFGEFKNKFYHRGPKIEQVLHS